MVRQGGALRGAAGFVDVGQADGRYYGSPVLAADPEAAEGLVAWLVAEARARRAGSLRISCGAGEGEAAKRGALLAAGFREIFRFLDLGVEVSDASHPPAPPQGYSVAGLATLPASDLAELASECFAAVENSPPMRCEDAEELLSGGRLLVAASEVVRDASGRPVGYLLATPDGWVDAVGVRSAARGLGLGRMLVARFLAAARGRGIPRVRARIASNNAASLRLHLGLGFVEDSSRAVLELRF